MYASLVHLQNNIYVSFSFYKIDHIFQAEEKKPVHINLNDLLLKSSRIDVYLAPSIFPSTLTEASLQHDAPTNMFHCQQGLLRVRWRQNLLMLAKYIHFHHIRKRLDKTRQTSPNCVLSLQMRS